jgi:hypothetical protein
MSVHARLLAPIRGSIARCGLLAGFAVVVATQMGGPAPAPADACPAPNAPNELTLAGGSPQTATLHQVFGEMLEVALANTNGCPVTTNDAGVAVTFAAPSSGATGIFAASGANTVTVGTNAAGQAGASAFTANSNAGSYPVTASSEYGSLSFSLTNTASGVAATIRPAMPASQSATVGRRYAQPLHATVVDAHGNPVDGATVTFTLGTNSGGGGSGGSAGASTAGASFDSGATQATAITDASGLATSPRFGANATAGRFTATAATSGTTRATRFALHNLAARPATITAGVAARESTPLATRFPVRLAATVSDVYGNPVAGVTVRFSAPTRGASGRFDGTRSAVKVMTDGKGVAVAPPFLAGGTQGGYVVRARAAGHSAAFALVNEPA